MRRVALLTSLTLLRCLAPISAAAQNTGTSANPEVQNCIALADLKLEDAPGGPALITSARLVEVPASGLDRPTYGGAGFGSSLAQNSSHIRRYCDVTGYVAPQNKFELKLPLSSEWNGKFFFFACGGFCGYLEGRLCNVGLARGYASATGNGGHDSRLGFDGVWAANAPELQEDFGWRSNHVVTLITKAITTHYYGKPIKYSYMAGGSKGGQAVLLEAQKFPEDFDGLIAVRQSTTTPDVTPSRRRGLRRPLATAMAARCSIPQLLRQSTSPCCRTVVLRPVSKKGWSPIHRPANGSRK